MGAVEYVCPMHMVMRTERIGSGTLLAHGALKPAAVRCAGRALERCDPVTVSPVLKVIQRRINL